MAHGERVQALVHVGVDLRELRLALGSAFSSQTLSKMVVREWS